MSKGNVIKSQKCALSVSRGLYKTTIIFRLVIFDERDIRFTMIPVENDLMPHLSAFVAVPFVAWGIPWYLERGLVPPFAAHSTSKGEIWNEIRTYLCYCFDCHGRRKW